MATFNDLPVSKVILDLSKFGYLPQSRVFPLTASTSITVGTAKTQIRSDEKLFGAKRKWIPRTWRGFFELRGRPIRIVGWKYVCHRSRVAAGLRA
jgi:hypothetical protein